MKKLIEVGMVVFCGIILTGCAGISFEKSNATTEREKIKFDKPIEVKEEGEEEKPKEEKPEEKPKEEKPKEQKKEEPKEKPKEEKPKAEENDYKNVKYKNYKNKRYGFSISVPTFLDEEEESVDFNGKTLWNTKKGVKLVVYGDENIHKLSAPEMFKDDLERVEKLNYKKVEKDSYIISWIAEGKVFYKKVIVGVASVNGFLIEYPEKDRKKLDPVIKKLHDSLKPGNLKKTY